VCGGVGHDVLVLRLRPEAAWIHGAPTGADRSLAADRGQVGETVDDQAESLVVAQVQMERVDLVLRDLVDQPLDRVRRLVVTGDVEQHSAVGVARMVGDLHDRHRPGDALHRRAGDPRWQQLPDRLHAVEQPKWRLRVEGHPVRGGGELVSLTGRVGLQIERERYVAVTGVAVDDRQAEPGGRSQVPGEGLRDLRCAAVLVSDDASVGVQRERSRADRHGRRLGHDLRNGRAALARLARRGSRRRGRRRDHSQADRHGGKPLAGRAGSEQRHMASLRSAAPTPATGR
jgi:hypothetical protein